MRGRATAFSKKLERRHGGGKLDPLPDLRDQEIVSLLDEAPQLRPFAVLKEMMRCHPDRDWRSIRRTFEWRICEWKALHGPDREVIFRQRHRMANRGWRISSL